MIDNNYNYSGGDRIDHDDFNDIINTYKESINNNYENLQKLEDGTFETANVDRINGANISRYASESLQDSDSKIPTARQIREYVTQVISDL